MKTVIEKVVEDIFFGKAPHWDIQSQSLYFVDYVAKTINRYVPATKSHFSAKLENSSSFLIPVEERGNKFGISITKGIAVVSWDGVKASVDEISKIVEIDNIENCNILNDGKCDEFGRLWTGTKGFDKDDERKTKNTGSLYSYRVGTLKKYFDEEILNGIAWNRSNSKMFYIDSNKKTVYVLDFDILNGEITNRQVLFSFEKHELDGVPYGMTSDKEENLWIAVFNGSKVIKISSSKPETLLDTINMPVKQVTSLAWGGEKLDELYVTTGNFPQPEITLNGPVEGSLYKVTGLKAKGLPMHNFSYKYLQQ